MVDFKKDPSSIQPKTVMQLTIAGIIALSIFIIVVFYLAVRNVEPEPIVSENPNQEQEIAKQAILSFERVGTSFTDPVDIVFGNGQLYIVEKEGLVKTLSNDVFLDISDRVNSTGNELGLLGMVFAPDEQNSDRLYLNYNRTRDGLVETVIARGTVSAPTELEELLVVEQPFNNHNAGDLAFGPDGFLYVPMGDGGSGGDPQNNAQNTNNLLGSILRIDVSGAEGYTVPENNPFNGGSGRDEIWSYGWRNPWRISFDPDTGTMYVGDVGQKAVEEISINQLGVGGNNYGWNCQEGSSNYEGCPNSSAYIPPLTEYSHTTAENCSGSVTGGFVYRGQDYPQLTGQYIFADFCTGVIYSYNVDAESAVLEEASSTDFRISTFGVDAENEIYFADYPSGSIYKLVDANARDN